MLTEEITKGQVVVERSSFCNGRDYLQPTQALTNFTRQGMQF